METLALWILMASPAPWAVREVPTEVASTREECLHLAVMRDADQRRIGRQDWVYRCRKAKLK